ncbi:WD40-repeat-containing domain [Pseudocohnilembus persalinus]|uniref:WD40-repeat-containing domain n=1 Tax=Pseudocohnilembus persalinus TaxID=266149 RepID=A0A0V0QJ56_PSEPJ|nr:WD40-repeat-containing domain [Pseudocohnilembus persalinus]|eukprot:KRX02187.1 WD40-repeat-containing domain [Pseudocohnilembus persalinus]
MMEIKPETITLDSVTTFICQKQAEDQAMVISRQGVLWLIDFSDKTTLRLNASHASQRKITKAKYIVNSSEEYHNGILFSASNDYTLKLFNMGSYELKSEFYSPKKDCLTFDIIPEYFIVCGGYNDGYIRFFQYEQNVNLGVVLLVEPKQNKAYPVTTVVAIPQTRNFLVGNSNGDIYMVYIKNLES